MPGTPHGNAQWANETLLRENGFTVTPAPLPESFVLGRFVPVSWGKPHPMHAALYEGRKYRGGKEGGYLGIKSDGHILTLKVG